MSLKSETTLKSVNVKLEGVAKSSVPIPEEHNNSNNHNRRKKHDSKRMSIEIHHVLYKIQSVFPPENVRRSSTSNQYTLSAGSYTYPFKFKIPVNSDCRQSVTGPGTQQEWLPGGPNSALNSGRIGSSINNFADKNLPGQGNKIFVSKTGVDIARAPSSHSHVDGILPPSLSGVNDTASIKYFVKVTVVRASMLKMNTRSYKPFIFLPLDPPRLYDTNKMAFVRRQITIGTSNNDGSSSSGSSKSGGGFFSKLVSNQKVSSLMGVNSWPGSTLTFTFEMRFPSAGTFVPLRALPIDLFAIFPSAPANMTQHKAIYVSSVDIILYAKTAVRAHEFDKEVPMQLNLCNHRNLSIPVDLSLAQPIKRNGQTVYELSLPKDLLQGVQLPDYVSPSFVTCNIARSYSIGVEVGFYCVKGIPIDHVALLSDIVVRSGINPPTDQPSNQLPLVQQPPIQHQLPPMQPPRPGKEKYQQEEQQESGELPTYDDVVAETSTQFTNQPRRNFEQAPDYYKIDQDN